MDITNESSQRLLSHGHDTYMNTPLGRPIEEIEVVGPVPASQSHTVASSRIICSRPRQAKDVSQMLLFTAQGRFNAKQANFAENEMKARYVGTPVQTQPSYLIPLHRSSCALDYVPFEPLAVGSSESKVKYRKLATEKIEAGTIGVRLQKPRTLGELGIIPRLIDTSDEMQRKLSSHPRRPAAPTGSARYNYTRYRNLTFDPSHAKCAQVPV